MAVVTPDTKTPDIHSACISLHEVAHKLKEQNDAVAQFADSLIKIDYSDRFEHNEEVTVPYQNLLCHQPETKLSIIESKTHGEDQISVLPLQSEKLSLSLYLVVDGYHLLMARFIEQSKSSTAKPVSVAVQRADLLSQYLYKGEIEEMLAEGKKRRYAMPQIVEEFSS